MKETIRIDGMGCDHCVDAVEKGLEGVDGLTVEQVVIGEAVVEYDPSFTSRSEIDKAIDEAGYAVVNDAN